MEKDNQNQAPTKNYLELATTISSLTGGDTSDIYAYISRMGVVEFFIQIESLEFSAEVKERMEEIYRFILCVSEVSENADA